MTDTNDGHDDIEAEDPLDGTYTAVLDRYEGDITVLVIEYNSRDIAERLVDRAALPEDARAVDTVLEVTFVDDTPTEIVPMPDETSERGESAQDRFDRLSRRRQIDDGYNSK